MNKYNEALGSWTIDFKDENYYSTSPYKRNSLQNIKEALTKGIKILKILEEFELFFLERVEAYFHPPSRINTFIFEKNLDEFLMHNSICNKSITNLRLYGKTDTMLDERLEEGLIILNLDFISYNFEISIHSDFALPVKRDAEYQIDLAIINSNRIETCLRRIKAEKIGSYIFPDEGMLGGESHTTIGFRIYLSDTVSDEEDFPSERKSDVEIFEFTEEQWFLGRKKTNDFFEKRRKFMRDVPKAK